MLLAIVTSNLLKPIHEEHEGMRDQGSDVRGQQYATAKNAKITKVKAIGARLLAMGRIIGISNQPPLVQSQQPCSPLRLCGKVS